MKQVGNNRPEEEEVILSPEQMLLIEEGIASMKDGKLLTLEEAAEQARASVKVWLPPSQSA